MKTTIDKAGRIVIPKRLRDAAGLVPGQPLDVDAVDGRIEIAPAATEVTLERRDGVLVAVPSVPVAPLTTEQVRRTLEALRR